MPEKWINEEILKFEKIEAQTLKDTEAMLKIQNIRNRKYDSDEENDLNGWDIS